MENTIEKRAENYLDEQFEGWESPDILQMCKDAYIEGANEQRKIDIEKAWRFFDMPICDYWTKENFTKAMEYELPKLLDK